MSGDFVTDLKTLRKRARRHIEDGAVTQSYRGNIKVVLQLLNEALATELVCVLRYKRHYYMAKGIHSHGVAAEFLEHAGEEQAHGDLIAARIVQLGGEPDFNPAGLTSKSHSEYVEGETLVDMLREDLIAERIAIESYTDMINYIGDKDPTTRTMLEGILAVEEEHAEDLATLLGSIDVKDKDARSADKDNGKDKDKDKDKSSKHSKSKDSKSKNSKHKSSKDKEKNKGKDEKGKGSKNKSKDEPVKPEDVVKEKN